FYSDLKTSYEINVYPTYLIPLFLPVSFNILEKPAEKIYRKGGTTLGVGLATGLIGMAADAMVEDINYTMITDVQIAERTRTSVRTDNVAALRQGTSGSKIQTSTETGNQHKYQTRVVSSANQANLKFEEAKPHLEDQLAKSIANIL
ncbi:complement resistance protein TraT, partial [Escherichia coli]